MSVVFKFKQEIRMLLNAYEQSEGDNIRLQEARVITQIRALFDKQNIGATSLWLATNEIVFTMEGKFFAFLPFVNDLKSSLLSILASPTYKYINFSQEEITNLTQKVVALEQRSPEQIVSANYVSIEKYREDMEKLLKMVAENKDKDTAEFEQLRLALLTEREKSTKLEAELAQERARVRNAEAQVEFLNLQLLTKNKEIETLKDEIDNFKQKLSVQDDNSNPNGRSMRSIGLKLYN